MKKLIELALSIQKYFKKFYLAGGTAIMIKYNHRKSMDLDFFSHSFFSFNYLSTKMRKIYVGALLSFEDYGKLPVWIKKTLSGLLD